MPGNYATVWKVFKILFVVVVAVVLSAVAVDVSVVFGTGEQIPKVLNTTRSSNYFTRTFPGRIVYRDCVT